MRHSLPLTPQFYVTAPQGCPYLDGKKERKLFTALQGEHAGLLHDALSAQGFRRSQNVLYRPSCADCQGCMSARIVAQDFQASRSQKRILKRNAHLRRVARSPWATEEQFELFRKYLTGRHADGGMADMDVYEFAAMIEETPIKTRVVEYWDDTGGTPELRAVCLTDVLSDGVSMVYSFYDPDFECDSLGTFMILDHVAIAKEAELPYVYLGYWVPGSQKMGYKAKFSPMEVYFSNEWIPLKEPKQFDDTVLTQSHQPPISEQVAQIQLPDVSPGPRSPFTL